MRTAKHYPQARARIFRPEQTHCLDCQTRLRRAHLVSRRTVVTLSEVIRLTHWGYRCPNAACPGVRCLYRSAEADQLALPGFTFGLDIVLLVGSLRLRQHQSVDEVHQELSQRLACLEVTISRREILFLFETYTSLLRALPVGSAGSTPGKSYQISVPARPQRRQVPELLVPLRHGGQPERAHDVPLLISSTGIFG